MPSITKSLPRRSTCFVWITLISITSTNSIDLDNHWKCENATILMMAVKLRARSTLECTLGCLRSSPYGSFCMRRSDNTCYLAVKKASPVQLLGEFSDVRCFSKGQPSWFLVYTHTLTHTNTHTHTHTHTYSRSRIRAHTHTRTHARTHARRNRDRERDGDTKREREA